MNLPFQPPLAPMEARHVDELPRGDGWQYEPKWDGFRAICFRDGDDVYISSRGELPFARYYPELVEALKAAPAPRVVLDGEIVVFTADGLGLDFDALQQRIHPAASRVARLSRDTPASFVTFDLLGVDDRDFRTEPLAVRRAELERVMAGVVPPLYLSPCTTDADLATTWLEQFTVQGLDGVVAKRTDAPYRSGEREMRKVKRIRTVDCVVLGFRWAKDRRGVAVGSLLLGLYGEDGELRQVGFSSGFTQQVRRDLVPLLEEHRSGPTVEVPSGPEWRSRWAQDRDLSFEPLRPELVAEVAYDQVTGHRIRHGARFLRWRPDKPPGRCTLDQLVTPSTRSVRGLLE